MSSSGPSNQSNNLQIERNNYYLPSINRSPDDNEFQGNEVFKENSGRRNKYSLIGRTILFVGGGNLSFELSYAKKHPDLAWEMVVTTYEDVHTFNLNEESTYNKAELLNLGVKVYHSKVT